MNLLLSLLAAGAYTVGGVFMRKSDGFAHAWPAAAVFACFCAGATLQTWAMRHSEVSINYVLVVGLEAVLAVLLGAAWLGEAVSAPKLAGLALILAGVTCLSLQEKGAEPPGVQGPEADAVSLRSAASSDVRVLLDLINGYAARGLLLRRTEASVRARLREFVVAVERTAGGERIVGCGALAQLGRGLGEVRSLAVRADAAGGGVGRRIVGRLLDNARERGLGEVLALTLRPSFFAAQGFVSTRRERFPEKLRTDCRHCPRNLCCDEVAMVASRAS